jgi:PAS domain S-box-containing protein
LWLTVVTIATDMTAPHAKKELREIRLRLASILDSAMDAILVAGTDGRIVVFNSKAEQTFGCRAADAIGQPLERFVARVDAESRVASSQGKYDASSEGVSATPGIVLARRADGEEFLADAVISRIEQAGEIECSVTLRDVSDRRRAQNMLRNLSSAVAHTADSVYVTDTDGIIEYVNPAFAATMGVTLDEVIGDKPSVFKSGKHDREFYERLWSTLRSGEVYRGVLVDKTRDGRMIHLDQTITPLKDEEGHVTHFVAVGRDITPRIETEAALRHLNESLEQQAREIAQALHDEAGQMLTSAYVALAHAKRDLPPSAHEHLQTIKQHLEEIEEQLRRVAHELRPRILEDLGLVPALRFLADGVSQRSGIAIHVESTLATRLSPLLEATIYRFAQETLSNTRRHAAASEVTIYLEHLNRRLRCTVTDDGVGLDAAAVAATAEEPGMGLPSIRARIAVLGGTFQMGPAPGRGTQVIITIPVEKAGLYFPCALLCGFPCWTYFLQPFDALA